MIHETPPPSSIGIYVKIPNYPGLYRHSTTGRYYAVKKVQGKRKECSLRTADRKIAERRMREWVANLDKVDTEVEKTTLRELSAKLNAIYQGKSKGTRSMFRLVLQEIQGWCGAHTQIRDIRPSQLEEYLAHRGRGLRNSSYNSFAGVLKQLFRLAVADRIIAESPFARVKVPWKKPQEPKRLVPTVEQFETIVGSIRSQRHTRHAEDSADFIEFQGQAGLGQAEASALTWGDVDWERECLRIRRHKTDTRFTVPIYPHLRPLMERLKAKAGKKAVPGARVFKFRNGKKALDGACARLGLVHFTQRSLRQGLILRLYRARVDVKMISKWQGHQDGGRLIMETYTEVFGDDDRQYVQQQIEKLRPTPALAPTPVIAEPEIAVPAQTAAATRKFFSMENPYKPGDQVQTNVKGTEVAAVVTAIWQNEVQVKTEDGKQVWRTMHTVWYPGSTPIPKEQKSSEVQPSAAEQSSAVVEQSSPVVEQSSPLTEVVNAPIAEDSQPATPSPEPLADEPPKSEPAAADLSERTACEVEPKRSGRHGKDIKRGKSRR